MLYIVFDKDHQSILDVCGSIQGMSTHGADVIAESRWDWANKPFEFVRMRAEQVSKFKGEMYIAIDNGDNVSPRFDIIRVPHVGDEVSYTFNGDYYPDGTVTKISDSFRRIVTSTGSVYYRRRKTGTWLRKGGTWALVRGHISKLNPEF